MQEHDEANELSNGREKEEEWEDEQSTAWDMIIMNNLLLHSLDRIHRHCHDTDHDSNRNGNRSL